MIGVDALSEPELSPADKRLLYIGLMMLADDAGCLRWDAVTVRGNLFPYGDVTLERALTLMTELELDEYVWPYEGTDGRQYAFLRDFPIWQKSRTRQYGPEVPLPPGITFRPAENRPNAGSGSYTYPESREQLEGSALDPCTQESQNKSSQGSQEQSTQEHVIALKGPAARPAERPAARPADGDAERPAREHNLPPDVAAWSREKFGGTR
jgi:hypothetical protein